MGNRIQTLNADDVDLPESTAEDSQRHIAIQ